MTEERLKEIKDSIDYQKEVLIVHNMGTLCIDEELELYNEVIRLREIIEKISVELNEYKEHEEMEYLIKEEEKFNYSMDDQVDY